MKFTEADLRHWERCKLEGRPLPAIPGKTIMNCGRYTAFPQNWCRFSGKNTGNGKRNGTSRAGASCLLA
jgi:hypothetical protein